MTSTKCMKSDCGAQKVFEIMYYNRAKDIVCEFLMKQQFDCKLKSQLVIQKEFENNPSYLRYLLLNFADINGHLAPLELNGIHFCLSNSCIYAVVIEPFFSHFTGNHRFDAFFEVCFEWF